MKKIKLVDFLEFVRFRNYDERAKDLGADNYDTNIIRIYYPNFDDLGDIQHKRDRWIEYGVYDFSNDTKKRIKDTLNPKLLDCYVSEVCANGYGDLNIYIVSEEEIDLMIEDLID